MPPYFMDVTVDGLVELYAFSHAPADLMLLEMQLCQKIRVTLETP